MINAGSLAQRPLPSPRLVRRKFDRAASGYDAIAALQPLIADALLERVDELKLSPSHILDLGCGTARATSLLKKRFRRSFLLGLDLSPRMLEVAAKRQSWLARYPLLAADVAHLPLVSNRFDLVYSNLMLHWVSDTSQTLAEVARVMKPGGTLCFSTLGPDTLKELRAAYAQVDEHTHVNTFLDMHDVGDALVRAGFSDPVLDVEHYTLTYKQVADLWKDLRGNGATALPATQVGLRGRAFPSRVCAAYETLRDQGRLPATFEVIFGRAIATKDSRDVTSGGEVSIPLHKIKKRPI